MDGSGLSRYAFLCAVALVAAAFADPVVETISDSGIFGGHYADHNRLSVIPTAIVGVLVASHVLVRRIVRSWRARDVGGDALLDLARDVSSRGPFSGFAFVLLAQLTALFVMEHAEQAAIGGPAIDGTAWLGGPIAFSLATHALVGLASLLLGRYALRSIVRTCTSLLRHVARFAWVGAAPVEPVPLRGRAEPPFFRAQAPHVRQVGGRAPPPVLRLARALSS